MNYSFPEKQRLRDLHRRSGRASCSYPIPALPIPCFDSWVPLPRFRDPLSLEQTHENEGAILQLVLSTKLDLSEYWVLVTGYWLLVAGHWSLATGATTAIWAISGWARLFHLLRFPTLSLFFSIRVHIEIFQKIKTCLSSKALERSMSWFELFSFSLSYRELRVVLMQKM